MSESNKTYTLTSKIGICFPPQGQETAQKVGKALVQFGLECELTQHMADSNWFLTVNPGASPEGVAIPQKLAHQIANEANGVFSGSSVATLINANARSERRAAANPKIGRGPRP